MDIGLAHPKTTLDSRFVDLDQPVLLSGIQALVRVLLEQARLDRAAGHRTAALVSGYRGSPLGGFDRELWRKQKLLDAHDIRFQPGVNEDLAATMLFGTQQLDAFPGARFDGVFGMWYGKGPGVDRTGDAFHCANMLGTHPRGGVLAVAGDDHGAHSSTYPHQTEHIFEGVMIPVLHPADVQDIVDFSLAGYALSRFSGLWVALKTTAETAEQAAVVRIPADRGFITPDFEIPPHGLNIDHSLRYPRDRAELEQRVMLERLPAALAWTRVNRLDRLIFGDADAPIGLVTVGRAHHDTLHALRTLGLDAPSPARALQGRHDLAAGSRGPAQFRPRQARPAGDRGKAQLRRSPGARRALPSAERSTPGSRRQDPALRRDPADAADGAVAGSGRRRTRNVPAPARSERARGAARAADRPPRRPAGAAFRPSAPVARTAPRRALPDGSFATAGIGCHFMAMDDGDGDAHLHPDGRRGRDLDRPRAVHRHAAPVRQYRRRNLHAFRPTGAAPGGRRRHAHHLQAAGQRRRGDDRRPTRRGRLHRAAIRPAGRRRGRAHASPSSPTKPIACRQPSAVPKGTTLHTRGELDEVQRELRDHEASRC